MKITILLRFPRLESSAWKISLIEKLIAEEFQISLVFGTKSIFKQTRAVFKEFGFDILKKKKDVEKAGGKNLFNYFKSKLEIRKVTDLNSAKTGRIIKSIKPDYILLLGTGIIRKNILSLPSKGVIHCHHGHLPEYRGVSTAEWSLFFEKELYITTHFVDPGIDTGDILLRIKIPVDKFDSIQSIRQKCRSYSVGLIMDTLKKLQNDSNERIQQSKEDGRQYYTMHPFFKQLVENKLKRIGG